MCSHSAARFIRLCGSLVAPDTATPTDLPVGQIARRAMAWIALNRFLTMKSGARNDMDSIPLSVQRTMERDDE
jgi:hypothetical protein